MIKKLTKHGNSLALILDKPVLELLKIDAETPLEISTDGQTLLVSPVRDELRRTKFQEALLAADKKYARMLKRLAE
jgi:antitoxin component of MazEF toxin-antitoxin module